MHYRYFHPIEKAIKYALHWGTTKGAYYGNRRNQNRLLSGASEVKQ